MADITLTSLSSLINQMGVELYSLRTTITDQGQRLTTSETDINTLQNPVVGVPPQLLTWLATHSIREVDTTLDTNIVDLQTSDTTLTTSVGELTTNLSQETTDRTDSDTTLQLNIDDLSSSVTDLTTSLNDEIANRAASVGASAASLDNVNSRIDSVESTVSTEVANRSTDSTSLFGYITTLQNDLQTAKTQIQYLSGVGVDPAGSLASQIVALTTVANNALATATSESSNRASGVASLQSQIDSISTSNSASASNIGAETTARIAKDNNLQTAIDSINATIGGYNASITAEQSARIAADNTLTASVATNTTNIATNTGAISTEIADRIAADAILTTNVGTNTTNIATNTGNITTLQTQMTAVRAKYGVTIDGFGYINGYEDLGDVLPNAKFFVANLNNDLKLQNPGYTTKYFPAVAAVAFSPAVSYSTQYGVAAAQTFHGIDGLDHSRNVLIYATGTVAANGSVFQGVDYSTGGSAYRLGQVNTTFLVNINGGVNRYLSLWYRIKATPSTATGTWYPVLLADNTISGARTYERASASGVVTISVTANQVIEFGLTVLNTQDATIANASFDFIYGGTVSIQAVNINGV